MTGLGVALDAEEGLVGGGFLGISALNDRGTVVFLGLRQGTFAPAIFAGNGGPLTIGLVNPTFRIRRTSAIA